MMPAVILKTLEVLELCIAVSSFFHFRQIKSHALFAQTVEHCTHRIHFETVLRHEM